MMLAPNRPARRRPRCASVIMCMHDLFGTALQRSTRVCHAAAAGRNKEANAGEGIGERGRRAHRMAEPHHPLAPRRRRHRLDRQLVLFHPSRSQPEAARRPAGGRPGRGLAGPRRRLLPHGEISGRAGAHAGRADLVQVGGLHHLALRLRAADPRLLSRRRALSDRQVGARPHRPGRGGRRLRQPGARLADLRGAVPLAARPARARRWRSSASSSWSASPMASPMSSAGAAPSPRSAR